jgi:acyl-CoA thioesterase FadM
MTAGWMETRRGVVTENEINFIGHMAAEAYFPKFYHSGGVLCRVTGLYYGDLEKWNIGVVAVIHKIRYLAELRAGDPYAIQRAFVSIGQRSLRYLEKMNNLRTGDLAAAFDTVEALLDFRNRRSTPWPDDLRAGVESRIVEL